MDFDRVKENNGVYWYQDNNFNTINIKLNFLSGTSNRECAISDLLCYFIAKCNKVYDSEEAITYMKRQLYSTEILFSNELINKQKVFTMHVEMVTPEAVKDDYYQEAFTFLRNMLHEPDFNDQEMFDVIKRNVISGLSIKVNEPDVYAETMYLGTVYPSEDRQYEYSADVEYIADLINSITLDELKAQYEKIMSQFQSGIVFGSISEERFNEFVKIMKLPEPVKDVDYSGVAEIKEESVEIPTNYDQSYVYVTYEIDNFNYAQMILLAKMLNSMIGLCNIYLREKNDIVYSSCAHIKFYGKKLYVEAALAKEKKQEFLDTVEEIVKVLQDEKKLPLLIEQAKREIAEDNFTTSEEKDYLIFYLNNYALKSFGNISRNEVIRQVGEITPEDLLGVTRTLRRKNIFMVRGNGDE